MPIGPNETLDPSHNEDEKLKEIQSEIDNSLSEMYMGGRIIIRLTQAVSPRLQAEIIKNYKEVGWKCVFFTGHYDITLDKVSKND